MNDIINIIGGKTKNGQRNYSYTTAERINQILDLVEALDIPIKDQTIIPVKHPNENDSEWEPNLPESNDESFINARNALQEGKCIYANLELPIKKGKVGKAIVIIKKSINPKDAIQIWCRGHIMLLKHSENGDCRLGSYSSMVYVDIDDPLGEVIKLTEGVAHLEMQKSNFGRFERYMEEEFGCKDITASMMIQYLTQMPEKIVNKINQQDEIATDWLDDLFRIDDKDNVCKVCNTDPCTCLCTKCKKYPCECLCTKCDHKPCVCPCSKCGEKSCICIQRDLRVENRKTENEHGFTITALSPRLVGKSWVARVGYGKSITKSNPTNPNSPPDNRIQKFDMEKMVTGVGVSISFDVEAKDGKICPDRFSFKVLEQEFHINIEGLNLDKVAQCICEENKVGEY